MSAEPPRPHHTTRPKRRRRPPRWVPRLVARPRFAQRSFGFDERSRRLARRFKVAILTITVLVVALVLGSSSGGRNVTRWTASRARWMALGAVGLSPPRSEVDADWQRRRQYDIRQTRGKLRSVYSEYPPPMRRLLDHAGLDPDHAVLRWGNFDKTLYLPSTVFEADETGRSYRFRPNMRSIWVRNLRLKGGILAYFPVPITRELDAIAKEAGAIVVPSSVQTTNSWGLRGPEPETSAPLRGIVLGDSYMQGLFVGDAETPVECLKRFLAEKSALRTEILNTGHMGYSTEQEYYTLREYADRFRPRFVVLSIFANDFGDLFEVIEGKGDWQEGKYWLGELEQFCRSRGIVLLAVPAPWVNQLEGPRRSGFYPGLISNLLEGPGTNYLDPVDAFADDLLRQQLIRSREGKPVSPNPLFNGHLGDGHFSPLGCQVWARAVGERIWLLLEKQGRIGSN
jgi:hypothetical protein